MESTILASDPLGPDPHTADIVTAVQYGFYERVIELIERDPILASKPLDGNITLLHWAAINNRIKIAKYLLSKNVVVDVFGGDLHSTPLHWAVRDGKLQMVIFLLSHQADPSLFDGEGFSSIHLASMFGHTDIVAYLIAKGQNVDLLDKNGMTPLMHAVRRIKDRDPAQILIRLGANVNYQNPMNQCTPLHYAIAGMNKEGIHILLEAGAKTDICNSDNESAFELISRLSSNRYLIQLLSSYEIHNRNLPTFLQFNNSTRRLGTKILPYVFLLIIACIFQMSSTLFYKILLFIFVVLFTKGYTMIFFDNHVDRYLPIAIAQASIFWLYMCYLCYFLPYVQILSFHFLGLVVCTYFSWKNYYLAQKCDPGIITNDRNRQYQNIIQLIEQNLFDYESFCTSCLVRKPIRSKHCRECHRCISKFDHHCPWIDNCVGEKNIGYFTGFLISTPLCLYFYLHGAFHYYRSYCYVLSPDASHLDFITLLTCSPAVIWFTIIALLHIIWISCLALTILYQIATGYTTNERINSWRYKYFTSKSSSPFSLGFIQNLVDLIGRSIFCFKPVSIDWTQIYSMEDYYQSLPLNLFMHKSTGLMKDTKLMSSFQNNVRQIRIKTNQLEANARERIRRLPVVLNEQQIRRLKEHKYASEGTTLFDPYMQIFWKWLVEFCPLWVAPNLLTIIGLIINIGTSVLLMIATDGAQEPCSRWMYILTALGIFIYQSLDAIDGKQARRTGSSSPLGELFDHGCDSVSTVFVSVACCCAVQLAVHPWLMFWSCMSSYITFYCAHWQTYVSGRLRFATIDCTEAQFSFIIVYSLSAINPNIWNITIPIINMEARVFAALLSIVTAIWSSANNIHTISQGGCGRNFSSVAGTSIIYPIWPIGLFVFLAYTASNYSISNSLQEHTVLHLVCYGIVFSKITNRLIVAHMSKSALNSWDSAYFGPLAVCVNQYFNCCISEHILLWFFLIYNLYDLLRYNVKVCQELCDAFEIHCFRIKPSSTQTVDHSH